METGGASKQMKEPAKICEGKGNSENGHDHSRWSICPKRDAKTEVERTAQRWLTEAG